MHQKLSSGAVWESIVGYSRAVRAGNIIEVAGTTAVEDGKIVGIGNPYEQTKCILNKIKKNIEALGGDIQCVTRTRMFVTNIQDWQEIGRAHGEMFSEIRPATTMVEVKGLIDKDMLVEIEATAVLSSGI
jgi:enamine deaminase RidA (YjgF/YER057c/UK114 family)